MAIAAQRVPALLGRPGLSTLQPLGVAVCAAVSELRAEKTADRHAEGMCAPTRSCVHFCHSRNTAAGIIWQVTYLE